MSLRDAKLSMLNDYNCFTMANGYFEAGLKDKKGCFDLFFRRVPDNAGFAVCAGLEQAIDYIKNLSFSDEDIEFLRKRGGLSEGFLDYLKNFKFECDVYAVPEGTPVFAKEPIVKVVGPIIQATLIETMLLISINHQTLIATKANRITRAALGREVLEFGVRRAHGIDAAANGARAAYIGGCIGSSCTFVNKEYDIPVFDSMTHAWVEVFDSEYEAFCTYAKQYPDNCYLLVDTYNTLKSGVINAIKCFDDVLKPMGCRPKGIRIDSGDITYISKRARKMLDDAGYPDCIIIASNSLDEYIIRDLIIEGAKVDRFCVGERLITSASDPIFGGVYKLTALENDEGEFVPKVNFSDNVGKITLPCNKKIYRLFDNDSGKAMADVISLYDENLDEQNEIEIFDPDHTWKRKKIDNFIARELFVKVFDKGNLVYNSPSVQVIRQYCEEQVETIWDEVQRFENPHAYYVDLSEKLWHIRDGLFKEFTDYKR
ncbi:MAG: nicotinate phosphoribosyltransferase [Acutalibacteraceae bacterium]